MKSITLCFLFTTLLAATARAQLSGPGLTWSGSMSGLGGSYTPSCMGTPVFAVRGETVTLSIWGDRLAPFALFASVSATQCLQLPGIGNGLVLDFPVNTVMVGALTQDPPCRVCPPGLMSLSFAVPSSVLIGTPIAFQAATSGNGNLAFTIAITATVQ